MKQVLTLCAMVMSLGLTMAQPLYTISGTLSGDNETHEVSTTATGTVTGAIYEDDGGVLGLKGSESKNAVSGYRIDLSITYDGLSGPLLQAHIHGRAAPGNNAGVLHNLGPEGEELATSGNMSREIFVSNTPSLKGDVSKGSTAGFGSQELLRAIIDGLAYVNLHTEANPGGELRANLIAIDPAAPIPTMGQWALFVLALLLSATAVVYVRRTKSVIA